MAWTEQVAVQCGLEFVVVPLVALDESIFVVRAVMRSGSADLLAYSSARDS